MTDRKKMKTVVAVLAAAAALMVILCAVLLVLKGADKKKTGDTDYAGLPTPKVAEIPTEEDWSLVLVNRYNTLDPDYMPELTEIAPDTDIYADTRVAAAYNEMDEAARNDGITLPLASGYVSKEDQKTAYEAEVKTYTDQGMDEEAAQAKAAFTVSPPGRAEENYGLSVGFSHEDIEGFVESLIYEWLKEHAAEYGFIERYTEEKEEVTHMKARPWHWRYVGRKAAEEMHNKGLSLEEYVEEYVNNQPSGSETETPELTMDEAAALYLEANPLYERWIGMGPEMDWDTDPVMINDQRFYPVVTDDYADIDEMKAALSYYFSPEVYEDAVDEKYRMIDGKLYGNWLGGGGIGADSYSHSLTQNSDGTYTFTITEHFTSQIKPKDYVSTNTIRYADGRWIFDSFVYILGYRYEGAGDTAEQTTAEEETTEEKTTAEEVQTTRGEVDMEAYLDAMYERWETLDEIEAEKYFWFDMDGDGLDEMIVDVKDGLAKPKFDAYFWNNGTLQCTGHFDIAYGTPCVKKGTDRLSVRHAQMGSETFIDFWLENGEVKSDYSASVMLNGDNSKSIMGEYDIIEMYDPSEYHAPNG